MESANAFKAEWGSPDSDNVRIASLDFRGQFVSSPSGRWRLAIETPTSARPLVRWALLNGDAVHSSGSAETAQVQAAAVADDATFVLARRTGRLETTIEVRENSGDLIFSTRMEALATSAALSITGRWAAVGFVEAKRGDEPIVVVDADRREVVKRIPARGGSVLSIDEERHVVVSEDGEFAFNAAVTAAPAAPVLSARAIHPPGGRPAPPPVAATGATSRSLFFWGAILGSIVGVIYILKMLIVWVFFTGATNLVKGAGDQLVREYEMASRHGDKADACKLARAIANFNLSMNKEAAYAHWQSVEKKDCAAAGR